MPGPATVEVTTFGFDQRMNWLRRLGGLSVLSLDQPRAGDPDINSDSIDGPIIGSIDDPVDDEHIGVDAG